MHADGKYKKMCFGEVDFKETKLEIVRKYLFFYIFAYNNNNNNNMRWVEEKKNYIYLYI